ncbi:hypothetical protein A2686_02750 [Candidatus Woesebacteria bacterium RIFCSPHIGHO2_01_FULL_38_10]|uniref:Aminoglycoside phosphotransferase domain-containing protein n=1 Tax=Candidatus Woesebacteria bacterium RIFCSPLOWO2_01_FULL_39_10b TaxID=1802517 RepID=A0A1F8B8V4_9BACT|nr:MAG: hypothetical protein A2686_02750 [Candidatus Woesebacteria bacterium RIFCSPHIGHO2_01_FULL_38_10]OGM60484.1 MAG: hypothetical protein A2892_00445 [Candidatus Woesebacteria bacterium RIFCSPLOWO2_01_FULL_39_10b]
MNKVFFDQKRKVFIKVLKDSFKKEREIIGANCFQNFVNVPLYEPLDKKTLKIIPAKGVKSTLVDEQILNSLIINLSTLIKKSKFKVNPNFSILKEIEAIKLVLRNKPAITDWLTSLQLSLGRKNLYPVHGDLQKQNIFVANNKISLIDFEHFSFAPLELEFANNLFFNSPNCLDVGKIIPPLIKRKIVSKDLLTRMLVLYSIRKLAKGLKVKEVEKRLSQGLEKIETIVGKDLSLRLLDFRSVKKIDWTGSSCLA